MLEDKMNGRKSTTEMRITNDIKNVYEYLSKNYFYRYPSLCDLMTTLYEPSHEDERIKIFIDLLKIFSDKYEDLQNTKDFKIEYSKIMYEIGVCNTPQEFLQVFDYATDLEVMARLINILFKYFNFALKAKKAKSAAYDMESCGIDEQTGISVGEEMNPIILSEEASIELNKAIKYVVPKLGNLVMQMSSKGEEVQELAAAVESLDSALRGIRKVFAERK